jgi:hypothetical protein
VRLRSNVVIFSGQTGIDGSVEGEEREFWKKTKRGKFEEYEEADRNSIVDPLALWNKESQQRTA